MIIIDVYQRLYCIVQSYVLNSNVPGSRFSVRGFISKWRHLFNYLENRTYEISYCFYTTKVMLREMVKITKLPKWLQKVTFAITLIEITKIAKNPYYNITWQYLKLHIVRPLMTYLLAKSITSCKAVLSLGSFSLKVLTKETVIRGIVRWSSIGNSWRQDTSSTYRLLSLSSFTRASTLHIYISFWK